MLRDGRRGDPLRKAAGRSAESKYRPLHRFDEPGNLRIVVNARVLR
jgi:hypothetical protein